MHRLTSCTMLKKLHCWKICHVYMFFISCLLMIYSKIKILHLQLYMVETNPATMTAKAASKERYESWREGKCL